MPRTQRLTLVRTVEPVTQPITLAEIKAHLRVDAPDEDALISAYLAAAVRHCEEFTRRQFMPATWRLTLDDFPDGELNSQISSAIECDDILLPRSPVSSITSISYKDVNGATQTLSNTVYKLLSDDEPARIVLSYNKDWPDTYDEPAVVTITYSAGYASAALVPESIKHAIKFLVGHFYENRENVIVGTNAMALPMAVESLLGPFVIQECW